MSTQKVAVAIIHGIGTQNEKFANKTITALKKRCQPVMGNDLIAEPVYWAGVLNDAEKELMARARKGGKLRGSKIRQFMLDFLGDAFAYQPTRHDRTTYDGVHAVFAATLRRLADQAGPTAPLCIIAHSLGTIVASNFIYDLQAETVELRPILSAMVRARMNPTPLELGQTLTLLYMLGSPLAVFSLRFADFGKPIQFPAPQLNQYYPGLNGEWVNFYDADDVIGFPLKTLNDDYKRVVTADREINVGKVYANWNLLAHLGYWTDKDVLDPIASALCQVWKDVNGRVS